MLCRKFIYYFTPVLVAALLLLPAVSSAREITGDSPGSSPSATVLVLVEELQKSDLENKNVPNIKGLIDAGTTVEKIGSVPETFNGAVSQLIAGKSDFEDLDTVFSRVQQRNRQAIFVDGTGELANIARQAGEDSETLPRGSYKEIMQNVLQKIDSRRFYCTITMPRPRKEVSGPGSVSGNSISALDNQVGLLLNRLRNLNVLDETHIIIAGTGPNPFLLFNGPQVREGKELPFINYADAHATAAYIDRLQQAGSGDVLYEALSAGGNNRSLLLEQRVEDLSRSNARLFEQVEQLRGEQDEVKRQQAELESIKKQYNEAMEKRQKEINRLKLKLTLSKYAGYLFLVIFAAALYIEYRVLKKKFLFFT